MIKNKKGYSLGILVITIAVMLILTTTALLSFKSTTADKEITNFMNDITEVEEYVKEYYSEKHILPLMYDNTTKQPIAINSLEYEEIRAQASNKDFGNYYFVDLTKLERIHLKDNQRGYIVNENSLRVYVTNPIEYQGVFYYTVTDEMRGYDKTYNENANFEVIISGNPIVWTDKAKLILSIPNYENIEASDWQFKYYYPGPISSEEFKTKGNMFLYGETVEITENGIVTFYAENLTATASGDVGYAKTVNVVVTKIDDIKPVIKISGDRSQNGEVIITDNETGINSDRLRYKIIGDDINNPEDGIPLLTYGIKYAKYIEEYNKLKSNEEDLTAEISDLKALGSGDDELQELYTNLNNITLEIQKLNNENRSFNDGNIPYDDYENNIALYVEDYAGNVEEDTLGVSRKVLLNSNLINFESKLLDNSMFSIVKTTPYTSGDKVKLRIRSQGATKMIITMDDKISPEDIANYDLKYQASNGDYEFDISGAGKTEVVIYAYYTAGEYDENGKLIYKALNDKVLVDKINPTTDAPKVEVSNKLKLKIEVKQKDLESGIFKTEYGYQETEGNEDLTKYTWCHTVSEIENRLKEGKIYYIRTRVTDLAGNGPVVSAYTKIQCPTQKILAMPNRPVLENMKAITWKNNLEEVEIDPYTLKDSTGVTRVWYDYKMGDGINDDGESMWANAKSTDGSYWVWIPRYAYRIIYYTDANKTEIKGYYQNSAYSNSIGYYMPDGKTASNEADIKTKFGDIDIVFLYGSEDYKYYDTETKLVKSLIDGGEKLYSEYIVHPAFKSYASGTSVNILGKWNRDLSGIWVAKFEASREDATFTSQGTANNVRSVPNVRAMTNIKINDAFNMALQLDASKDSHLMKNSEWGAVTYLAYSAYGRGGNKVRQNLSSNMITGAGTSSNGATYATTSESLFEGRYSYKTSAGMQASTTKNIYGVYDMVGGALEYVSAYVNNENSAVSTNGSLLQNSSTLYLSQSYNKGGTDSEAGNYRANAGVYGDAIYEISLDTSNVWKDNVMNYPNTGEPFFARGGSYSSNTSTAGIFETDKKDGAAYENVGFRIVLVP